MDPFKWRFLASHFGNWLHWSNLQCEATNQTLFAKCSQPLWRLAAHGQPWRLGRPSLERCLPHAPMEDTEEGTENLQIVLPAGASRRAPASVRTFAEGPAASPAQDSPPLPRRPPPPLPKRRTQRTQRRARRAFRSFQDDCAGPVLATSPLALPVPRGGRLPGGLWYPRPYYAQPPRKTFYLPSGRLYNRPNNHPFPLLFLAGGCTNACFRQTIYLFFFLKHAYVRPPARNRRGKGWLLGRL